MTLVATLFITQGTSLATADELVGKTSQADQLRALDRLALLASEVTLGRQALLARHGQRDSDRSSKTSRFTIEGRVDLGMETLGNVIITTSADPGVADASNLVMKVSGGCLERQLAKQHFAPVKIYWTSPGGSAEPLIGFKHMANGHDVILFFDAFGQGCLKAVRSEATSASMELGSAQPRGEVNRCADKHLALQCSVILSTRRLFLSSVHPRLLSGKLTVDVSS